MRIILFGDRVKLLRPVQLAEPLGVIPAGVIGEVRKAAWQEGAALVEWHGPYHSCPVNSQDLAHASLADLMPGRLHQLGRWTLGRVGKGVGLVATVVITVVVTLEVQHFLGKCGP